MGGEPARGAGDAQTSPGKGRGFRQSHAEPGFKASRSGTWDKRDSWASECGLAQASFPGVSYCGVRREHWGVSAGARGDRTARWRGGLQVEGTEGSWEAVGARAGWRGGGGGFHSVEVARGCPGGEGGAPAGRWG